MELLGACTIRTKSACPLPSLLCHYVGGTRKQYRRCLQATLLPALMLHWSSSEQTYNRDAHTASLVYYPALQKQRGSMLSFFIYHFWE
jgi:hypothetical protein